MFTKLELVEFVWREMNRKKEAAPRLVAQKKIKQRDETQLKEIQQ